MTTLQDIVDAVNRATLDYLEYQTDDGDGDGVTTLFRLTRRFIVPDTVGCVIYYDDGDGEDPYTLDPAQDFEVDYTNSWCTFNITSQPGGATWTIPPDESRIVWAYAYKHWDDERIVATINEGMPQLYDFFYVQAQDTSQSVSDATYEIPAPTDAEDNWIADLIIDLEFLDPYTGCYSRYKKWRSVGGDKVEAIQLFDAPRDSYGTRITYIRRPEPFPADPDEMIDGEYTTEVLEAATVDGAAVTFSAGLPPRAKEALVRYCESELVAEALSKRLRVDHAINTQAENAITMRDMNNAISLMKFRFDNYLMTNRMQPPVRRSYR